MYGDVAQTGSGENGKFTLDDVGYFSVPAFFITFREFLEAAIIIAVLLGLLSKMGANHLRKYVWFGVVSAAVICVLLGVIFIVLINVLKEQILTAESTLVVEGVIAIIAAILIAIVASAIGNVMAINEKYEKRLTDAVERDHERGLSPRSIFYLTFSTVIREGLETIIFFTGTGAAYPAASLPIPAVTGAITGTLCGLLLYKVGGKLTIKYFFICTMVILVFIGAGVFTNGVRNLQLANAFGEYTTILPSERSALNQEQWNISDCCGYDKSQFWIMARVLVGYTPEPTGLEILMYCLYHICVWSSLFIKYKFKARKERGEPALFYCGRRPCGGVADADSAAVSAKSSSAAGLAGTGNSKNDEEHDVESDATSRDSSGDIGADQVLPVVENDTQQEAKSITIS